MKIIKLKDVCFKHVNRTSKRIRYTCSEKCTDDLMSGLRAQSVYRTPDELKEINEPTKIPNPSMLTKFKTLLKKVLNHGD